MLFFFYSILQLILFTKKILVYTLIIAAILIFPFLPFSNLGLIIVDEAHEPSFKQYNPAPRYQARDSAIVLARIHQGKLLMGSATPSLESYHNAKEGKYGLVSLNKRFGNIKMPTIELIDIKEKPLCE